MGRDEVSLFPSYEQGEKEKEELSYGDICRKYCADYLAMGMSPSEYWDGDPKLTTYYRDAQRLKDKKENFNAWLHGLYIYNAMVCVSPLYRDWVKDHHPEKYFAEPIEMFPKTKAEAKDDETRQDKANEAAILSWIQRVNRKFEQEKEDASNGR